MVEKMNTDDEMWIKKKKEMEQEAEAAIKRLKEEQELQAILQRRKRAKWLAGVASEILKDLEECLPKATHAVDHTAVGWPSESKLEP